MPIFWYHATFEESFAILDDLIAKDGIRWLPYPGMGPDPAWSPAPRSDLPDGDDVRSERRVLLVGPFTTSDIRLGKYGPEGPYLVYGLGRCTEHYEIDAEVTCHDPANAGASVELDNAFDDLVERMKTHLVAFDAFGTRCWVSPSMRARCEATKAITFSHGGRPRIRNLGYDGPGALEQFRRMTHEPPVDAGWGEVRADRGSRPATVVRYRAAGDEWLVTSSGSGGYENFVAVLEVVAQEAAKANVRLRGADERTADLLGADRRFALVRATARRAGKRACTVPVSKELARFCRDVLLAGERVFEASSGLAELDAHRARIAWWPDGRDRRYGFETVAIWELDIAVEDLDRIGKRAVTEIEVLEKVWECQPEAQAREIERVFAPLALDGAVRLTVPWLHAKATLVPVLVPLVAALVAAAEERDAAVPAIVAALEASPLVVVVRRDEVELALRARPLAPEVAPRTEAAVSSLARSPELDRVTAALASPHARFGLRVHATTAAGEAVVLTPNAQPLTKVVRDDVLPYVRPAASASAGAVLVEVTCGADVVRAAIPEAHVARIPALRALVYGGPLRREDFPAEPRAIQLERERLAARLRCFASGGDERGGLSCQRATAADARRTVVLHASGAVWRDDQHGDERVAHPLRGPVAPSRVRELARRLLAAQFPQHAQPPGTHRGQPRLAFGLVGRDEYGQPFTSTFEVQHAVDAGGALAEIADAFFAMGARS